MTHPTDISLHAEAHLYGSSQDKFLQDEDTLSVAELIPQILMERKSFVHLSEDSIAAEIEARKSGMDIDEDASKTGSAEAFSPAQTGDNLTSISQNVANGSGPDSEDGESSLEKFHRQKVDLLGHIGSALNETSLSLDFVSLLMSAEKPNITKSTISPHLSKTVPLGSLSADRLESVSGSVSGSASDSRSGSAGSSKNAESIGLGWKYQSLRNVTGLFRGAASQLRGQVAVEKNYWHQINKVLAHGEVLYKLRDPETHARAIGVQYGYGDSGSTYHDRGVAVLRKNDATGDVSFRPMTASASVSSASASASASSRNRFTRVRVLSKIDDDYMLTGQSALQREELEKHTDEAVLNELETARFFLFEDDLFYHLVREAKNLIGYNVTIIGDKIIVDVHDQVLELESIYYDAENEEDLANVYQNTNRESSRDNARAQQMLNFLKIMLCCYYRYRLTLKHKMPTSYTKWKQANSHPLLLRPLLGHIRHQRNCRQMKALLDKLCRGLDTNSVTHELQEHMYANLTSGPVENPFQKAVQRPLSTFTIVLEKVATQQHLKAEVEVTASEIFVDLVVRLTVARYKSKEDLEDNHDGSNVLSLDFTDLMDVGESLDWTLANFLEENEQ
ncbi:hypothetical protein JCM33374_g2446 [Metschnikowia sp. JCM 33374]|nr:hypothetical protein JCM33374_g2446 [Metschnikowia sp. JCM 33374]